MLGTDRLLRHRTSPKWSKLGSIDWKPLPRRAKTSSMNSEHGFPHMVSPRLSMRAGLLAALLAAGALGGCGVRSNLEAPPEAKANGTAAAPDAGDAGPNSAVKAKPHKPFVLDGLIR